MKLVPQKQKKWIIPLHGQCWLWLKTLHKKDLDHFLTEVKSYIHEKLIVIADSSQKQNVTISWLRLEFRSMRSWMWQKTNQQKQCTIP